MIFFLSRYRRAFLFGMTVGFAFSIVVQAFAQEVFPSRPIEFVVPLPPGGVADMHARSLAPVLERIFNQPVTVQNKEGSVSKVGTQYVLSRKADGYTILIAMASFFSAPEVDRRFGRTVAYELEQFTPLARLSAEPLCLHVRGDAPWKSVADLVADAKRNPGKITFVTTGMWSTLHLSTEIFAAKAGIKLLHIPYKGAGPAVTAVLGGHGDMLPASCEVGQPYLKAGDLRVLATTGAQRCECLPEVPTLKELGYDVEFYMPVSVIVRKETPPNELRILKDAFRQAVKDPDFKSAMDKLGTPIAYLGGEDLDNFWKWETETMIEAIDSAWKTK